MDLTPINGCVLVRLTEVYEYVTTPDKKYDTKTSGILIKIAKDVKGYDHLIGKKVFFESYKDDTSKEDDGQKYALLKAEDLKGYEDAKPSATDN